MSNWILDLNKLVNTKDYPDMDLQASAHTIMASYGQSNNEKERENIKGNINLYINNLKDRINDPIIEKKYNILLKLQSELSVLDQTHPIEEIVKPEGPKINSDPENMVMPSNIVVDKRNVKKRELSYAEQDELLKMEEEAIEAEQNESKVKESNITNNLMDDIVIPDKVDLGDGEIIDLHAPAPTEKVYHNIPLEPIEETIKREEILDKLKPEVKSIDSKFDEMKAEVEKIVIEIDDNKLNPNIQHQYSNNLEKFMNTYNASWIENEDKFKPITEAYNAIKDIYNEYKESTKLADEIDRSKFNKYPTDDELIAENDKKIQNMINEIKSKINYIYYGEIFFDYLTQIEELNARKIYGKAMNELVDIAIVEAALEDLEKLASLSRVRKLDDKKSDNVSESNESLDTSDIITKLRDKAKIKYNSIDRNYLIPNEVNKLDTLFKNINEIYHKEYIEDKIKELDELIAISNKRKDEESLKDDEIQIIELDEDKPKSTRVPNPKVEESNVSFDEIAQLYHKDPDPKILRGNGTKLEKLIKYKNSEVNGRKVYLPDSNYEVIVNQVHDRTQINFMYNMMLQNGVNIDDLEASMKEEFIHILYDHCIFPLQEDITYNEFISNLSPNDLELLFVTFSLVNTKLNKDNILPLHIPYLQCDNCDSTIALKEEIVMDLAQEFKNIYDTERFISNYKIYRNSNFKSNKEAYTSGEYGQVLKLTFKEGSFNYTAYICRPTVQKQLLIKSNNELIAYRSMAVNFTKRASYLRKTMSNIDNLIDYLNTHSYAQFKGDVDYINKNNINLRDPNISEENKLLIENVTSVLTNMEDVLNELSSVFFAALIIDTVVISTGDGFETTFTLNDGDIYEFIEVIKDQLPSEFTQELAERAEEMDYVSKDVKIFFTADEVADKLDFYSIYKKPEDLEKVLRENKAPEEAIKKELERVEEIKKEFDSTHRCTKCGHGIYKVGYNTLLFFSITNLLN
jgi:hypothetical protein